MNVDFRSIADTRIQLHWASQLLSAAADATLDKSDDDSHSNLGWDADSNSLVNRANCSIDVIQFRVVFENNSSRLIGQTLSSAKDWLADLLGKQLKFRDYDMPDHRVRIDQPFSPSDSHLKSIAGWFTFAQSAMSELGSLRVWPHHFDLGFWRPGNTEGKSIGGGFSLGDEHYDQPYFYINPYGVEKPDSLAELPAGHWSEHWFGAVLLAEDIFASEDYSKLANAFTQSAMSECEQLTR